MNIVIIGAHPDDPEVACGGLALKAVRDGHRVVFLYFTNGDKNSKVVDRAQLAAVREQEARAAASFCGAEPNFFGFGDRELWFDPSTLQRTIDFLKECKADLVLAHWPADQHPDHQVCGVLATQAILQMPDTGLAFYEACIGVQTFGMLANRYSDISDVVQDKRKMVDFHASQSPEGFWWRRDTMHKWYGTVIGVEAAEAYYLHKSTRKSEEFFSLHEITRKSEAMFMWNNDD